MDRAKARDARKKDKARFGGLRYVVLERDSYKCVDCGMSQEEHQKQWGKSLTINHIDGQGRNSTKPNNVMENLETLCLKCHGKKDGPRWLIDVREMPTLSRVSTSFAGQ